MAKVIYVDDNNNQTVLKEGDINKWDILFRTDYFATKLWCDEDIEMRMTETGYTITPERVKAVLDAGGDAGGTWWGLEDCSDDWYAIDDVIHEALGEPDTEPYY